MKPIKLSISVDAVDHYIYKGDLYIVVSSGGIIRIPVDYLFAELKNQYLNLSGIIDLAFRRSSYWNSRAAACFLNIPSVNKCLRSVWDEASKSIVFNININDLDPEIVVNEIPSEVLNMQLYADNVYLGCRNGYYASSLDSLFRNRRIDKKFDAKTFYIQPKYGKAVISFGHEGMFDADALKLETINDPKIRKDISFLSAWTQAGGLMNYSSRSDFQFIGNKIESKQGSPDKYVVTNFAENFDIGATLFHRDCDIYDKIVMSFNDVNDFYFITQNRKIFKSNIRVSNANISKLNPIEDAIGISDKNWGRPLSGLVVAGCPVIEYDDKVVLFQNKKTYILEDIPIISMRSYPKSTCFRDIVSITCEDCIDIFAIDVFDMDSSKMYPDSDAWKTRYKKQYDVNSPF